MNGGFIGHETLVVLGKLRPSREEISAPDSYRD